jgi:hypothetical protein
MGNVLPIAIKTILGLLPLTQLPADAAGKGSFSLHSYSYTHSETPN